MTISITELDQVRETSAALLDELGLAAYLFEVEPREDQWELKVECAVEEEGAWEGITLPVSKEMLLASQDDASIRQRILAEWRARLIACKILD